MKRFFGFVKKEFYHIFRDPRTLLILFGLPIAQILIFGYVVTNEIKDVKIAVYDQSHDLRSTELTNKILSSGYFILVKNLHSSHEIEQVLKKGEVKEVIVFPVGFSKQLETEGKASIQLVADAIDPNIANMIVQYTSGIIGDYTSELNDLNPAPVHILSEPRMVFNPSLKSVYMFVPGTMALILILVSAMMTSITIAREKEMGSMEAILVSPLSPVQIILGKVTPYMILSIVNALSIIGLGYFVFDVPVNGSFILLLFETILFILLSLSIGILISTVADRQQTAMFISMFALMLPTMILSGFIFPVENMPLVLQWLSNIVPPKWYIIIIKNIMLKGTGLFFIWKETLILLGMIVFFIALSVKKFKIRLE